MTKIYHSNGKLLLTGEYVVLDGAKALAIPTRYGQSLEVIPSEKNGIHWKSLDPQGTVWFSSHFSLEKLNPSEAKNVLPVTALLLINLLNA